MSTCRTIKVIVFMAQSPMRERLKMFRHSLMSYGLNYMWVNRNALEDI
jgi:hypothetical protein